MLKSVVTAVELYHAISIGNGPLDSCLRIDERETDNGEGDQRSFVAQLHKLLHPLKARTADLPGGNIDFPTFGTSDAKEFLMISKFGQEFAPPSSCGVSKRLLCLSRTLGQQLHLFL
jgi:hypothetical protein